MMTTNLHVNVTADGHVLHRRTLLRRLAAGAVGTAGLSWMDNVRAHADELRKQGMACILLFMRGGPSQFETFDPKPGTETGGETTAIATPVPGIQIAKDWPRVAQQMQHFALVRSMTSREGNHQRAVYNLHTGYPPSGSVKYPSMGSIVASELGDPNFDLPHFVSIGGGPLAGGGEGGGAGFLGAAYAPFVVNDPNTLPLNIELPSGVDGERLKRRLGLMDKLEREFAESGAKARVTDHRALYQSAKSMVLSPRLKAFDLEQEKAAIRDRYGRSNFGQGCLLARRLVEAGVTFVEVTSNGWDTHEGNWDRIQRLAGTVDPGMAALVADLKERGMLERTLVIWMGEFGRTPTINARGGRDHYPRAFNIMLAGAGIKGGQVIGATDKNGREVKDRPVTVPDLFCSLYQALKINPRKENISGTGTIGRPIKLVDGGTPVKELFA